MRRASFAYDTAYPIEPLPLLRAEFRVTSGSPGPHFVFTWRDRICRREKHAVCMIQH